MTTKDVKAGDYVICKTRYSSLTRYEGHKVGRLYRVKAVFKMAFSTRGAWLADPITGELTIANLRDFMPV